MVNKKNREPNQWYCMDIHLHTPASSDFHQPEVTYLDILQRIEAKGVDIAVFTDHNTIAGYRKLREEINQLELFERTKRILPEEQSRLNEYRRLLKKILLLPGFEFTATFGFHIIGVFSPDTPLRDIEHILLDLRIPSGQIDDGSATVGATSDVLTAYRHIAEAGGLVIAAHANSSNGVAMRGFPFGGQTKIAYTQDMNLHALEVTDLDRKGSGSTSAFFSGTKPEYPRRMHCIQGSDAHRLTTDPQRKKNLGVGERTTDVYLPDLSFEALKELFLSNDFSRTRPRRQTTEPAIDYIRLAREQGANLIQDFHEAMTVRGGRRYAIIADVCALANTNGGTLYVGLSADPREPVAGFSDLKSSMLQLEKELDDRISPPLNCTIDIQQTGGKQILRVLVPRGDDPPYAVDDSKIYIRSESETGLAVRDEIVNLVLRSTSKLEAQPVTETVQVQAESEMTLPEATDFCNEDQPSELLEVSPPRTGVEVVCVEERKKGPIYTLRDLRNGNVVKNVTHSSARRLWHYAISAFNTLPADLKTAEITWQGDLGLLKEYKQANNHRYDMVQRQGGGFRYYFGVTEEGIHGPWRQLAGLDGGAEED